ncbi:MAG: sugar phosphate nucleotidyltransferase [bacterium]
MSARGRVWPIILAAGEGKRLLSITATPGSSGVPKQYWDFGGGSSMLRWTLRRAACLAPSERITTIVAREHRRWWEEELRDVADENIVVQPENRGTAAGILLPLLHVMLRDQDANVVILPSDHFIEDEDVAIGALLDAISTADRDPRRVVLLGMSPDSAEHDYGWIVPARSGVGRARFVDSFIEKPSASAARALFEHGALWNSFMLAGSAATLVEMFGQAQPELLMMFIAALKRGIGNPATLDALYRSLRKLDFSTDVLQKLPRSLAVLSVPPCGWTDLGTPARVARWRDAHVEARSIVEAPAALALAYS